MPLLWYMLWYENHLVFGFQNRKPFAYPQTGAVVQAMMSAFAGRAGILVEGPPL